MKGEEQGRYIGDFAVDKHAENVKHEHGDGRMQDDIVGVKQQWMRPFKRMEEGEDEGNERAVEVPRSRGFDECHSAPRESAYLLVLYNMNEIIEGELIDDAREKSDKRDEPHSLCGTGNRNRG